MADPEDEDELNVPYLPQPSMDEEESKPAVAVKDYMSPPDDKPPAHDDTPPEDKPWTAEASPEEKPWAEAETEEWQHGSKAADRSHDADYIPDDKPWQIDETPDDKPWQADRDDKERSDKSDETEDGKFVDGSTLGEDHSRAAAEIDDASFDTDEQDFLENGITLANEISASQFYANESSSDVSQTEIQTAASKVPTDEATLHLQALLDTVGSAGLGETFTLPEPEPLELEEGSSEPEAQPETEASTETNDDSGSNMSLKKNAPRRLHRGRIHRHKKGGSHYLDPEKPKIKSDYDDDEEELAEQPVPLKDLAAALAGLHSGEFADDDNEAQQEPESATEDLASEELDTESKTETKTETASFSKAEFESVEVDESFDSVQSTNVLEYGAETSETTVASDEEDAVASSPFAIFQAFESTDPDLTDDTTYDTNEEPADFASALAAYNVAPAEIPKQLPDESPADEEDSNEAARQNTSTGEYAKIANDLDTLAKETGLEQQENDDLVFIPGAASGKTEFRTQPSTKPSAQTISNKVFTEDQSSIELEEFEFVQSPQRSQFELGFKLEKSISIIDTKPIWRAAIEANVALPPAYSLEYLEDLSVMLPDSDQTSIGEFGRSTGLMGKDLNSYYEIVFLKATRESQAEQALDGLRFEVLSGKNHESLTVLQELLSIQFAIDLANAKKESDSQKELESLCRLCFLDKKTKTATELVKERRDDEDSFEFLETAQLSMRQHFIQDNIDAITAYGAFLSRSVDLIKEQKQAQRLSAIKVIEDSGARLLSAVGRDDFIQLSRKLRSIYAILFIEETDSPRAASAQVRNLRQLNEIDKNAANYLAHIDKQIQAQPGIGRLSSIETDLSLGGMQPLKLLRQCIPDISAELDALRLEQIRMELNTESNSFEFEIASNKLEDELRHANEAATAELKWTRTGTTVKRLSEAINSRSLSDMESVRKTAESIKGEMDRLCQLFYSNNPHARNSLIAIIMFLAERKVQQLWRQEQELLLPELQRLSTKELSILAEHSALVLNEAQKANLDSFKLRASEARGLISALTACNMRRDTPVEQAILSIFMTGFKGLSRSNLIDALLSGEVYLMRDNALFESLLNEAAVDGFTSSQMKQVGALAKRCVQSAIGLLSSIVSGALDVGQAVSALEHLQDAATLEDNRPTIIKLLLDEYHKHGDKAQLLAILGQIASAENSVDDAVVEAIRLAFEKSAKSPFTAQYKSASKGFLSVAKFWKEKELVTLCANLRLDLLKPIADVAPNLSQEVCDDLLARQHESLVRGKADERLIAIQIIASLLKYASHSRGRELARDLEFFLSPRGESELQRIGLLTEKLGRFLELANLALNDLSNVKQDPILALEASTKAIGIVPFEASRALDEAATSSADSLNSTNPNHAEVRRMYESKLQLRFMNTSELKKALALPMEDRSTMESMLIDGTLSAESFSFLIEQEHSVLANLFSVPPRICSNVLLPALSQQIINPSILDKIVHLPEPQRQSTLDFASKALSDSRRFTQEHFTLFMALPPAAQIEFSKAIESRDANDAVLTADEIREVLSTPSRMVSGRSVSDAGVLINSIQKRILTIEQVHQFNELGDMARAGLSGMLKAEILDGELTSIILQRVKAEQWTDSNLRDLGVAALLGWLPQGFLKEFLHEDVTLQTALFERLANETPQGKPGGFSLQAFLRRLRNINEWVKHGLLNKAGMTLLSKAHGSDLILMSILEHQSQEPAEERITPEIILQVIMQTRANKIAPDVLEAYRLSLERGFLNKQTFKSLLGQLAEQRKAGDQLLKLTPETFADLARDGRYRDMPKLVEHIPVPSRMVFSDTYAVDGKLGSLDPEDFAVETRSIISSFVEPVKNGDTATAIRDLVARTESREVQRDLGIMLGIVWQDTEIEFSKLNDMEYLESLKQEIIEQNKFAHEHQKPEAEAVYVSALEPIICIQDKYKFKLRNIDSIWEDGHWRACSPQERNYLESISRTESCSALFAKIGLQLCLDWLSKEAELKAKAAEDRSPVSVKNLSARNFNSILESGHSTVYFPNGMAAEISVNRESFEALESAFNMYMSSLRKASKSRGRKRTAAMNELLNEFEKKVPALLEACGVKLLRTTNTPYLIPIYKIELSQYYLPPASNSRTQPINLNLQQGLRRFLAEHASGKFIYDELARVKFSGITPKYDPVPPGRKPTAINPADQRTLTEKQRSAVANAILNDFSGLYQNCYTAPENDTISAKLEMCILKIGAGRNSAEEAFDRAEQWSHLMYFLNDFSPLSQGGQTISDLYDAGEFNDMHCDRDTLLIENDYIQMMQEFGIVPERWQYEVHGFYRDEVDARLKRDPSEYLGEEGLLEIAANDVEEPTETFARGESVLYNDEDYRVIARVAGKVLLKYEGRAREPLQAAPMQVSSMELESNFTAVQPGNSIHFLSNSSSDTAIYVLSSTDKGQKLLHTDSSLRFVQADYVTPANPNDKNKRSNRELSFAPAHLARTARKLFDSFKEYGIIVQGKGTALAGKQEILGKGVDANIKIQDESDQVSDRHLQIVVTTKGISVQDLNSASGTFLNWKKVRPYDTLRLRTCDQVNIGSFDGPELKLFCKPRETSTGRNYKVVVGSKILTPDRALTIGRIPTADVFVSFPTISRIHATIRMDAEGKVIIKDGAAQVPSSSGLVVNGKQLIPGSEIELHPGDAVTTRTGVELPIKFVEKTKIALEDESGNIPRRFPIKNSSLRDMFAGVDSRHGVYTMRLRVIQNLTEISNQLSEKTVAEPRRRRFTDEEEEKPAKNYKLKHLDKKMLSEMQRISENKSKLQEIRSTKSILLARGSLSEAALAQSNAHAEAASITEKLEDGWCNAGRGVLFDKTGKFSADGRIATAVNRGQDHVLRGVIDDAKRRFASLLPEARSQALMEYVRELLTPRDMTPDQLDQWYDQFCQDHAGMRVLLGEFIKEGKGIAAQQAALLKLLADQFDDLQCKLLRGMHGNHSWTTFTFDGVEYIHDPRVRFISPIAGEEGAEAKAKHWIPDAEEASTASPELRLGSLVTFDGTNGWRVVSIEVGSDEVTIGATGTRLVSSADLVLANPGRTLVLGDRYNIPRPDGMLDQGLNTWIMQSITRDGNLRMIRPASIQIRVKKSMVRPIKRSIK